MSAMSRIHAEVGNVTRAKQMHWLTYLWLCAEASDSAILDWAASDPEAVDEMCAETDRVIGVCAVICGEEAVYEVLGLDSRSDEAAYLAELERGYAQDRI